MTDVLAARAARLTASVPPEARPSRRLVVVATLAGVAAPLLVVFLLWAVGLVAWFAADGGSHGTTLSVLRLAGDGWLLAHGAHLELAGPPPSVVTASPLGLTLVCVAVTVRVARWAASHSPGGSLRGVRSAALALTGAYAVTGLVVALLSRSDLATPGLISTVVGCLLLGGPAGALGLVLGTGNAGHLRDLVPVARRSVLVAALAGAGLMLAAGAALTAGSLAWHGGAAAEVAGGLDLDVAGVVFSLLLAALIAPNAALLGSAYLAGPGFAVGTGTVVSTAQVSVGPLPTVPLLAAIPGDGAQPGWLVGLLAVPPLLGIVGRGLGRPGGADASPGAPARCAVSAAARSAGCCSPSRRRGPAARSGPAGWPTSARPWSTCCCGTSPAWVSAASSAAWPRPGGPVATTCARRCRRPARGPSDRSPSTRTCRRANDRHPPTCCHPPRAGAPMRLPLPLPLRMPLPRAPTSPSRC